MRLRNQGNKVLVLPELLPYDFVNDTVIWLKDGSCGAVYELYPPPSETKTDREKMWNTIRNLLEGIGDNVVLQLILSTDENTDEDVKRYLSLNRENSPSFAREFSLDRARKVLNPSWIYSSGLVRFKPRRIRYFLTLKIPPAQVRVGLFRYFLEVARGSTATEKMVERTVESLKERLAEVCEAAETILSTASVQFKRCGLQEIREILANLFKPGIRTKEVDKSYLLANFPEAQWDGICEDAVKLEEDGVIIGERKLKLYYLNALPASGVEPGCFTGEIKRGGNVFSVVDLFSRLYICLNIHVPDQRKARGELAREKFLAQLQAAGSVEARAFIKDVEELFEKAFVEGRKLVSFSSVIVVEEKEENLLRSALMSFDLPHAREWVVADLLFKSVLPLGYVPAMDDALMRRRRSTTDVVACIAPLYGTFRGTETPTAMYLNRRGEPAFVDLFEVAAGQHAVIVGVTGAGKSVFTADLILQYLRTGARVFVVDLFGSYRALCSLVGGVYYTTDKNNPVPINIFSGFDDVNDRETLSSVVGVLGVMATAGKGLPREYRTVLSKAVIEARRSTTGELTVDRVVEVLEKMGEEVDEERTIARQLAIWLFDYTSEGTYGRFFEGGHSLPDVPLVVFDIAGMEEDPELTTAYLFAVFQGITGVLRRTPGRKLFVADEVWKYLAVPAVADILRELAKTYRKFGTAMITITQEPQDFFESSAGRALVAASSNKFFLRMEREVVMDAAEKMALPEELVKTLLTLMPTVKKAFSEVCYVKENTFGVIRVPWSNMLRWSTVTNAADRELLERMLRDKKNVKEALLALMEEET